MNEAALLAARREQNEVRQTDFLDALEKIVLGPERPLLLSPRGQGAHRLSRGRARDPGPGRARRRSGAPGDDRAARPGARRDLPAPRQRSLQLSRGIPARDESSACSAGARPRRSSTARKTTGAESDIEQATALARHMVTRWGMSERLGMVQLAPRENPYLGGGGAFGGERPFSEAPPRRSTPRCMRIIHECHEEARRLLSAHRKQLDALVEALLKRETLNEQEILEVTGLPRAPALASGKLPMEDGGAPAAARRA